MDNSRSPHGFVHNRGESDPVRSTGGAAPERSADALERTFAERVGSSLSESLLLRGYGLADPCGRCGGSGLVAHDPLRATVRITCPRCGGSGQARLR